MTRTCTRCHRDFTRPSRRGLCPPCYMAVSDRQKAYGRWETQYVNVQPVREHITALRAAGMGTRGIAAQAGVHRSVVTTAVDGKARPGKTRKPATQILERNAAAILAVPLPTTPIHMGRVDATGTRRRVQALIAYGYSQRDISRRLGHQADNLTPIVNGSVTMVARSTRDAITALFAELQMTPGPCARAKNRGRVNRWPLPLDWDEDDIDNPAATAERSPRRSYDPRKDPERIAWRRTKVTELLEAGLPATEIAARLRCTVRTIERDKQAIRAESLGVA